MKHGDHGDHGGQSFAGAVPGAELAAQSTGLAVANGAPVKVASAVDATRRRGAAATAPTPSD